MAILPGDTLRSNRARARNSPDVAAHPIQNRNPRRQFFANATQSQYVNGKLVEFSWMLFHFDVPGQRWRVERRGKDGAQIQNSTQFYRLLDNTSYAIDTTATGRVYCSKIDVPPGSVQPPVVLDPSAVDLGPSTAGGQPAELWEAHMPKTASHMAYVADTLVQAKPAAGRAPMGLTFNFTTHYLAGKCEPYTSGPCDSSMVRDNTGDLSVGPMPDWLFYLPDGFDCHNPVGGAEAEARPAPTGPFGFPF